MTLLQIAVEYYNERIRKSGPHLQCEKATQELALRLQENKIDCTPVVFTVDATLYDGPKLACDELEHHCIKIGCKILDVTAGQFKNMPLIYFGSRPLIYK